MKSKYRYPFFLIIQIIVLQLLSFYPESVEKYYSNSLYVTISIFLRKLLGSIPFSLGDCFYLFIIYFIIKWFWHSRGTWKVHWQTNSLQIVSFISIFYFMFHILWGLNYYRQPLFEKMNIEREYTNTDLLVFTKKLIAKTNQIHGKITKSDGVKVVFPYTQEESFEMNTNGFQTLSKQYTFFDFKIKSSKKSLFSLPLTYMGFSGYLNPFTNEANVNYLGPMYNFPMTTNHEMAHQMGFASESECNFIGFLASIKNKDNYFQYAGYSYALRYCLSMLEFNNQQSFDQLLKTIHPGILKNYEESKEFRKKYQTPIETGFHAFYDQFLKLNQQKDGLESYNKFVNLMVNYYQTREL